MKFLYIGTSGSEDPTRAGLNLLAAKGAKEAGHDVEVVLSGDAVVLFNDTVAANVQPVGLPSVKELPSSCGTTRSPSMAEAPAAAPVGSRKRA